MINDWTKGMAEECKEVYPTKVSRVACETWWNMIKRVFTLKDIREIIIPVVIYVPGKHSDDGAREYIDPIVINVEDCGESVNPITERCLGMLFDGYLAHDIALNRNIMIIEYAKPPTMLTLDVIDTDPAIENFNGKYHGYTSLKTQNGYHLYSHNPTAIGGAIHLMDPKWKTGFIRVTESEEKGEITKVD